MTGKATTKEAYQLMHDGALALATVEGNGIRIDAAYLQKTTAKISRRIQRLEESLRGDEVFKVWRRRFGEKTNLGSLPQLTQVLFGEMKIPYPGGLDNLTATKRFKANEETISTVDLPFAKDYARLKKLQKLRGTYLKGLAREVVNGLIHPFFNLHNVITFRSSSANPNFQNLPIRDQELGELIRRCFIAREGHHLVEVDFSGIEVRVSATYNKDPVLIKYIEDPTTDMHRDTAMDLFFVTKEQVEKATTRDWAKNRFVFPQFYGSVYFQCAPHLWQGVQSGAKLPGSETTIKEHLKAKGITRLGKCLPPKQGEHEPSAGTFEYHVREVERSFWNDRFKVYTAWKNRWYDAYLRNGKFRMHTGFVCEGVYKRNDVLNYAVQGSASHCKLWALIQLQKWLDKYKLKTKIVGEIHDSILADCPANELQDYLAMARKIMTVRLPRAWTWLTVPLDTESDVTPMGGSWYEKKQWVEKSGVWGPKAS